MPCAGGPIHDVLDHLDLAGTEEAAEESVVLRDRLGRLGLLLLRVLAVLLLLVGR